MKYLGWEYRLQEVSLTTWKEQAEIFRDRRNQDNTRTAIGLALSSETKYVRRWLFERVAPKVTRSYLALLPLGIAALRAANPDVEPIDSEDITRLWSSLDHIPKTRQMDELQPAAVGELAVIRQLNRGYTEGVEFMAKVSSSQEDRLALYMSAIHAHGLMHFASQRPIQ